MNVGSRTVKIGIAKNRFSLLFLKNWNMSRVFHMITVATVNRVNSRATLNVPSMVTLVKPNSLVDRGHSSCSWPPTMKSAIAA